MTDENYSNFITTVPNKGFYDPDQPDNHRKEKEEGKRARAKEKRLAVVFCIYIYIVDF